MLELSLCRSIVRNRFTCSKSHTHCTIKSTDILKLFITSKSWFTDLQKRRKHWNCTVFRPRVVWFFFSFLPTSFVFCLFSVDSLDFAMTRCRISTQRKKDSGWGRQILFYSNFRFVCMTVSHKPIPQKSSRKEEKKEKEGTNKNGRCNISSGLFLWLHQFPLGCCLFLLNTVHPLQANFNCLDGVQVSQLCIMLSLSVLNIVVNRDALLNSWQEIDNVRELCLSVSLCLRHTHPLSLSLSHTRKVLGYHLWVLHQLASTQLAGRSDKVPNMLPNGPSRMNEILCCLILFFFILFCTSSSSSSTSCLPFDSLCPPLLP